jgi:hypothetical protein
MRAPSHGRCRDFREKPIRMSRMEHWSSTVGAVLLACVLVHAQVARGSAGTGGSVPLVRLSETKLEHCERSGLLRPVCPRVAPKVGANYLSNLSVELTGRSALDVFNLERGGEYPRSPERNRPPRMAHVVAVVGSVDRLASFQEPQGATGERLRDGLMRRSRTAAVSFGRVGWAGRVGALYLMPPFPHGGMLGNHLVFSWRQGEQAYALSLHAWEPLTESVATLRTMLERLPTPVQTDRLMRLSPVRRVTMPRGLATMRATISAPSPQRHAFDVFVVASARADVGIRIETPSGHKLRILDSTRGRDCHQRPPLRTCYLRFPRLEGPRSGVWTIVMTKRSIAAARVRVDVSFR